MNQHQRRTQMPFSANDSIKFIKAFREINSNETPEFKERKQKEAEILAEFITASDQSTITNLATKSDLKKLENSIESLRTETKSDLKKLENSIENLRIETKSEIENLRVETKSEIESLRVETRSEIESLRVEVKSDIKRLEDNIETMRAETKQSLKSLEHKMSKNLAQAITANIAIITTIQGLIAATLFFLLQN